MNKVFVYGTLKEGHGNNHILKENGVAFLSKAYTYDDYLLVENGIPYMLDIEEHGLKTQVQGELYFIMNETVMDELDLLEGHPILYHRTRILVVDEDGDVHKCWAYIGNMGGLYGCNILRKGVYNGL